MGREGFDVDPTVGALRFEIRWLGFDEEDKEGEEEEDGGGCGWCHAGGYGW